MATTARPQKLPLQACLRDCSCRLTTQRLPFYTRYCRFTLELPFTLEIAVLHQNCRFTLEIAVLPQNCRFTLETAILHSRLPLFIIKGLKIAFVYQRLTLYIRHCRCTRAIAFEHYIPIHFTPEIAIYARDCRCTLKTERPPLYLIRDCHSETQRQLLYTGDCLRDSDTAVVLQGLPEGLRDSLYTGDALGDSYTAVVLQRLPFTRETSLCLKDCDGIFLLLRDWRCSQKPQLYTGDCSCTL